MQRLQPQRSRFMKLTPVGTLIVLAVFGCGHDPVVVAPASNDATTSKQLPVTIGNRESLKPPHVPLEPVPRPVFVNASTALGIEFTFYSDRVPGRFFLPEVMGGGAGWGDFDRDGWLDLYLMNGAVLDPADLNRQEHGNKLFRSQRGRQFRDVSEVSRSDDTGYGQGCVGGDFNGDGFEDLYLTNYGPNVLLLNNGDGSFSDITAVAEVGDDRWGTSGVWVDLNADGNLDLYAANYMDVTLQNNQLCQYGESSGYCGPGRYDGVPDLVYISNGDGTFRESARELGFNTSAGKGLAVSVTDFDNDFRPDIYVANDMEANFLFTQAVADAAGKDAPARLFADIAPRAGCAVSGEGMNEASMGIACSDFDGDGRVDIYLTHYYKMKNTLYHNLGGMLFEDDSWRTGVAATSLPFLGFGTVPLDFNGDRFPDLFVANGHVLGPAVDPNAMPPQLLLNNGKGGFSDVSGFAGPYFEDIWIGRGAATADFDNDGDTDLAVTHLDRPVAVLRNDTQTGRGFIGISLERTDRVPPLCARITVTDDEGESMQVLGTGGSYLSTHDERLLFAVSRTAGTVSIDILWPSGRNDHFEGVSKNQYWRIVEGGQPEETVR